MESTQKTTAFVRTPKEEMSKQVNYENETNID